MAILLAFPVKRYLPHLILTAVLSTALVVAYESVILQSSTSTTPKVTWVTKPLAITFNATIGFGSGADAFSCNPSTGLITLTIRPVGAGSGTLDVSASPDTFAQCGASLLSITVTATCLVPPEDCRGRYSWLIQVTQNYRTLADPLQVSITVT